MLFRYKLLLLFLLFFHFNVFSDVTVVNNNKCNGVFDNSKLDYVNRAVNKHRNDHQLHPEFTSVAGERKLVEKWNIPPSGVPNRIKAILPEDVYLIGHQLPRPANPTTVKLGEPGNTVLMARAHYTYAGQNFATNVTFSSRALASNLRNIRNPDSKNWLVGEDAVFGIVYLHGGGTRSTGGHTAEGMINHYKYFNIDVLSLDLSWHGEGHREVLPPEVEIKALSAFVQKYVPSSVPVVVWGHSWGATWAEMLMGMVNRPHDKLFFHHNTKGVLIMSPPVDAAPGKGMHSKLKEYQRLIEDSRKNKQHLYAPKEVGIWTQMVHQGKINPLSSLYTMLWILHLDHRIPKYMKKIFRKKKGETSEGMSVDDLLPGVVVEGMNDPLTGVNFIKFFRQYYAKLKNITFHLLKGVGHLLGDYKYPGTDTAVDIKVASDFIAEKLGLKKLEKQRRNTPHSSFISIVQEYANNLPFREYVAEHSYFVTRNTSKYGKIEKSKAKTIKSIQEAFEGYHSPTARIKRALERLESIKDEQDYQEVIAEIQTVLSQPDFFQKLSNIALVRDLSILDDHTVRQRMEDGSFHYSVGNLQSVRQLANEIVNNSQFTSFFQQHTSVGKKIPPLVAKVVNAPSLETAKELVKAEKLPRQVEIVIIDDLRRLFEMKEILNSVYVPTFESIAWRSSFNLNDRNKIEERINSIRDNVEKRILLRKEIEGYRNQLKQLQSEYKELSKVIAHNIRLIKEAFDKSATEIPDSLKEDLTKSYELLQALEKTSDKLNEAIEQVLVSKLDTDGSMNVNIFKEVIDTHADLISEFMIQYNDYANNYRLLRKKLIVAIEEGEMGEEFQTAVIAVYGRGSGGNEPLTGSQESRYLKLKRNMEDMAELESKLYRAKTSMNVLDIEYQSLFTDLLQVIQLRDKEDPFGDIPHMYIHYSNTIKQLLSGDATDGRLNTQEQREEYANFVRQNEREFQHIYKNWKKDMESDLPPYLPTSDAVEF